MKKFVVLFGPNGHNILAPNDEGFGMETMQRFVDRFRRDDHSSPSTDGEGIYMEQMHITRGQLEHRFQFHPADTKVRQEAHQLIREVLLDAADQIVEVTGPPTREQSLAITKLEEAMFWANAAVARENASTR